MAFENLFIRVQRSLGGIQLDSTIEESHDNQVQLTQNPVENGVDISDHAISRPKKVQLLAIVSDSPLGVAAFAQIVDTITGFFGSSTSANITRSQQAYNALVALMDNKEPIVLTTRLVVYDNMVITAIATKQDKNFSRSVLLNISLEQVIITESQTISISEDNLLPGNTQKQASSPTDAGRKEPAVVSSETNSSVLSKISGFLGN